MVLKGRNLYKASLNEDMVVFRDLEQTLNKTRSCSSNAAPASKDKQNLRVKLSKGIEAL